MRGVWSRILIFNECTTGKKTKNSDANEAGDDGFHNDFGMV